MIKGLLLASGSLTYYIVHGKWLGEVEEDSDSVELSLIGYSILNIIWLLCVFFAILSINSSFDLTEMIISWIITIVYPILIILLRIHAKKVENEK